MQKDVRRKVTLKTKRSCNIMEIQKYGKAFTRRIPYTVGYSWNRGGRLKELRIRHLARKFFRIWMQKTFGRVHPHKARSLHTIILLSRVFEAWREEWWTCRREWSLMVRAECHHRYYIYNQTFRNWKKFVAFRKQKKWNARCAQSYVDRQRIRHVWDKWEVYLEMGRMKGRMLKTALQQRRLATLRSAWNMWQRKLQKQYDYCALESQSVQHWALTLQRKAWLLWKEEKMFAVTQREKASKAYLHSIHRLQRKVLHQWTSYVTCRQAKKKLQDVAVHVWHLSLVKICWSKWNREILYKQVEGERLQAATYFAQRNTQHRIMECWRTYIRLSNEEAERCQIATHHKDQNLLAGLRGLSLNVTWSRAYRLNNIMAVQHYRQTIQKTYWRHWQDLLEKIEDTSLDFQMKKARAHYRTSLSRSVFHQWKMNLVERRHMQGLENRADTWFTKHKVPHCFNSWVEMTLRRRLCRERRDKSIIYNQQRQYKWVFYTWWEQLEKRKEERQSERMAILHEEWWHLRKAWTHWRLRAEQQVDEREKRSASDHLYLHRLLQNTVNQWKDNSTELRDRKNQEKLACRLSNMHRMRRALNGWLKFVQSQRENQTKLSKAQHYHDVRIVKHTFQALKQHRLHTVALRENAECCYRLHRQKTLSRLLALWKVNAGLSAEARVNQKIARTHFQYRLQVKMFLAWKQATSCAMSKCLQQVELLARAQSRKDKVKLHETFSHWRKQATKTLKERLGMEKAEQHHNMNLLLKAVTAWNSHYTHQRKYEAMQRQGIMLLSLKTWQNYFEKWKVQLKHRRQESKQTEQALWHWSLSLQAKVLYAWRLWVSEKQRKQAGLATAAHLYRDQPHTAHMSSLAQCHHGQGAKRLQRVVERCAWRWKQRALCKPGRECPPKKRVSFCLPTSPIQKTSSSLSVEQRQDRVLSLIALNRAARLQPRQPKDLLDSPVKELGHYGVAGQSAVKATDATVQLRADQQFHEPSVPHMAGPSTPSNQGYVPVRSCFQPPTHFSTSRHLAFIPARTEAHRPFPDPIHGSAQDVLLPPSSFMQATATNAKDGMASSSLQKDKALVPPDQFMLPCHHQSSEHSEVVPRAADTAEDEDEGCVEEERAAPGPTLTLTRELLSIRTAMNNFQRDRKQLRTLQRMAEVMEAWLQTSTEDEQEQDAVCRELDELKERVSRLGTEVANQKPLMLLHAARLQHLDSLLNHSQDTMAIWTQHQASLHVDNHTVIH